ncbi:uncharacterized protein PHALS_07850 [Plasmopara halstedii]|uniref:Uncharacterized protein n=1 Tax=Plasmopara halstedii TaxID=4781 RepID=A0A0P1B718_PLAHL|nr:uncharacterized protein PHALS_07850 [Plasmopara halstedii]CEG50124.1 hypothetical protein PHALS_07850 [Plasmopara halstedii]|eukprot:XP_024586493.1 hypothetical protein PHALS_07850 [Plasmopara halstedii]
MPSSRMGITTCCRVVRLSPLFHYERKSSRSHTRRFEVSYGGQLLGGADSAFALKTDSYFFVSQE